MVQCLVLSDGEEGQVGVQEEEEEERENREKQKIKEKGIIEGRENEKTLY